MEGKNGIPINATYWIERRGRRTSQATPIEVSQLLDFRLRDQPS